MVTLYTFSRTVCMGRDSTRYPADGQLGCGQCGCCVPRDVADEGAGVAGDEQKHDDADPDAGPQAEGQVLEPHALAKVEHDGLKHEDGARRA